MTNRRELAELLSTEVAKARLQRWGEELPKNLVPFGELPAEEQRTWLDIAEAVFQNYSTNARRLHALADDWEWYGTYLRDPEDRNSMRRALVVEIRSIADQMWEECGGNDV